MLVVISNQILNNKFRTEGNVPKDLVPPFWLALLGRSTSAEAGLNILDKLKTKRVLEKETQALQEQLAQKEQALQELEKEALVKESERVKHAQAQTQPAGNMPKEIMTNASQSPLLLQFSVGTSRDKILLEKLSADATPVDEDERPPNKLCNIYI